MVYTVSASDCEPIRYDLGGLGLLYIAHLHLRWALITSAFIPSQRRALQYLATQRLPSLDIGSKGLEKRSGRD
ncbi:hypothetical protein BDW75DRAFT_213364 [Aspergillus navahoensis]